MAEFAHSQRHEDMDHKIEKYEGLSRTLVPTKK